MRGVLALAAVPGLGLARAQDAADAAKRDLRMVKQEAAAVASLAAKAEARDDLAERVLAALETDESVRRRLEELLRSMEER